MGYQKSYSSVFNKYWESYRKDLNDSESNSMAANIQQTKNLFSQTIVNMLKEINPELDIKGEDIEYISSATVQGMPDDSDAVKNRLKEILDHPYHFKFSNKILGDPKFVEIIEYSDMIPSIEKLSEVTTKRIAHIQKGIESENGKKILSTTL